MMRPITCLSLMVAMGAGLYLYQVKHRAQLLDRDINRVVKLADAARDRTGLLKAEWALLEDPQRLQDLADRHLQLQPLQPSQFVRLEDLASRLPSPASAPAPALVAAVAPAPTPELLPVAVVQPEPAPAAAAPVRPAPSRPARPPMLASLAKPPAPRPRYAPVMPAYEPGPAAVHFPPVQTASATAPLAAPSSPYIGSSLGMARTMLAPPMPVAPGGGGPAYAGTR